MNSGGSSIEDLGQIIANVQEELRKVREKIENAAGPNKGNPLSHSRMQARFHRTCCSCRMSWPLLNSHCRRRTRSL